MSKSRTGQREVCTCVCQDVHTLYVRIGESGPSCCKISPVKLVPLGLKRQRSACQIDYEG